MKWLTLATLIIAFGLSFCLAPAMRAETFADSLYIVKPEADSLHWGSKVIGATAVTRTVRLLNHCPDTLIGIVYSSNACYTLNGASKDTLHYLIPDTTGVFQFTVSFIPTYRGTIDAWVYFSDPFDSIALYGAATGGTIPKPLGPSLYGAYPFSNVEGPLNTYGQAAHNYTSGFYPIVLYGGASMEDISAGCWRPAVSSFAFAKDTTNVIVSWTTDSLCNYSMYSYSADIYESDTAATAFLDTIHGLSPEYDLTQLRVEICKANDASCCVDIDTSFYTNCLAMSSPLNLAASQYSAHLAMISWDTRTPTEEDIRYKTDDDLDWTIGMTVSGYRTAHAVHSVPIPEASQLYYVSVRGDNACGDTIAWSDSLSFITGADGIIGHCPTVAKSSIATKTITASSVNLTLNTDLSCIMRFRYHASPSGAWAYRTEPSDSTGHTIAVAGLSGSTGYVWETKPIHSQCPDTTAVSYGDSTAFTTLTACPTVTKSNYASQLITSSGATLHFHSDYAVHGGFRYHATGNNPWVYRHDADADSLQHTIAVAGLNPNAVYVWQSNYKYVGCDSSAYGDSTSFTTACPTVTPSGFATKAITSTGATLTFTTDIAAHAHFKYALYASSSYTHRHDADADSAGTHTVSIAGLTANYIRYKWLSYAIGASGCDSTFANQQNFYTACTLPTVSNNLACYDAGNYIEIQTAGRGVYVQFRIRTTVGPGEWTTYGYGDTVACHRQLVGTLANTTLYDLEYQIKDECGTERGWTGMGTGLTNSIGRFTETCLCGGA